MWPKPGAVGCDRLAFGLWVIAENFEGWAFGAMARQAEVNTTEVSVRDSRRRVEPGTTQVALRGNWATLEYVDIELGQCSPVAGDQIGVTVAHGCQSANRVETLTHLA